MTTSRVGGHGHDRAPVVWEALVETLGQAATEPGTPLRVVDVGGGTGGLAVRVARLGHVVTVVDPSPDALASLRRRADDEGLAERLAGEPGDAASLADVVGAGSADVVLLHGVLEVVDDEPAALAAAREVLRPGGRLSLVAAGRWAAVVASALAGDLARAHDLAGRSAATWDPRVDGPRRYTREEIVGLVEESGLGVDRVDAVRVFTDLVPADALDTVPGAQDTLIDLERAVTGVAELAAVASLHHVLASRPPS